ncbi:MAG TPA: 23S rRNA (guanosine(2251)-2'-O)-methyltransferase RlmB, partial [Sphingomonadales bacterium]|nr:23S rRNA (guanosine(2251)-2'-O)-methyltransferase RlmB [Sphingomonadales bacterium]
VLAALANPLRRARRLIAAGKPGEAVFDKASSLARKRNIPLEAKNPALLAKFLPADAPHQGLALEVEPLEEVYLEDAARIEEGGKNIVLVLDQLTDPHNVGAMFRSALAFGVKAIVTQDRHAPPESGALAKAASGALDRVPWVRAVNLSRTLDELYEMGYWRLGLDGAAEKVLAEADLGENVALVLGAEGTGARRLTLAHCDLTVKIPIAPAMESLNVSVAAAIALYALTK